MKYPTKMYLRDVVSDLKMTNNMCKIFMYIENTDSVYHQGDV